MNRAIIIENESSQRQSLKNTLVSEGFTVDEAVDGQRGIALARDKNDIAVIFIGDKLTGLSGMDTLIAIRKFQPKVPVLMLMSTRERKFSQLALSRGAAWFLHKPVQIEDVLVVIRHLMERHRLQQTIDHQVERLQLLEQQTSELTQFDTDVLPTEEVIRNSDFLSKSIDIIASVLEAKKVSLMLLSPDGNELIMGKSNWILPSKIPNIRQPITQGVAGRVVREGKSIIIRDVNKDPDTQVNEYTRQYESPSFLAAPIRMSGKVIGVVTVNDRKDKIPFNENDLVMLNTFCHQMSMSIVNMCMMKKTEREKLKLQFLHDIVQDLLSSVDPMEIYTTLLGKIMNVLRATAGMLAFTDPKGNQISIEHVEPEDRLRKPADPVPVGNGVIATVFKTEKVVVDNETPKEGGTNRRSDAPPGLEVRNIAAAPIRANNKVLGVLVFYNKEENLPFDTWDMEILHSVIPQASMAIKQAWLYQNLIKSIDDVVDTNKQLEEANREIRTKIRELERLKKKVSS